MTSSALRRLVAALLIVLSLAAVTPTVAGAAETREGSTALASRDFNPENQIKRLYFAVLARDVETLGLNYWLSQYNAGLSLETIASVIADSDEFRAKYGNLDDKGFVEELYRNVFSITDVSGRADGIAYWTGLILNGTLTRAGVIVQFSESQEFRNKTYDSSPLDRLYCAFFLRPADPVGGAYWDSLFRDNNLALESIAGDFALVEEFGNTYGSLSSRQFVELIYKNVLGRSLPLEETAGPDYWTGLLGRNQISRGAVMVQFSESQEYLNRFTDGSCPDSGKATPKAINDRGTVTNGGTVKINWKQNDVVPTGTTVSKLTNGAKGTTVNNGDGTFTYTHNGVSALADSDTFTYTLRSADGVTATASVAVTILPAGADGVPIAVDDGIFEVQFETPTQINWAVNDIVDDTVSVKSISTPANGTVTNNGDNTFTYTPKTGFSGADSFTYTLTDNGAPADTSTATVTLDVKPKPTGVDDGINPVANGDRVFTYVNTQVVIPVLDNDQLFGEVVSIEYTEPGTGSIALNGDGTFTYTPAQDDTISRTVLGLVPYSFTYTLRDDDVGVSTATVEIYVLSQPQCEVFMNYPFLTGAETSDPNRLELFFSTVGCSELYSGTLDVVWSGVELNSVAVGTTSEVNNIYREFVAITTTPATVTALNIHGFATLTQNGANAVQIEFELDFVWDGANWQRDGTNYQGREIVDGEVTDDVTVLINPLIPS